MTDINDLRHFYRNTFSSPEARIVLKDILTKCYFFNDNLDGSMLELIGKQNVGREIVFMLGTWGDGEITKEAIIDGILKTPFVKIKEEDQEDPDL